MAEVVLDANLLVLLIAGATSRDYIGRHRRLQHYNEADFDCLAEFIAPMSGIIVTPNILTETSNLVSRISEPAMTRIAATFRHMVTSLHERFVESKLAVTQSEFPRIWLTDAGILTELRDERVLLTADLDLYLAALRRGCTAVNFNHIRPAARG